MLNNHHNLRYFITTVIFAVVLFSVVFLFLPVDSVKAGTADTFGVNYGAGAGLATTDIRIAAVKVIRTVLGILGIIALILLIYGGFVWMTSGGNPQKIELAKKILLNTLIGFIIIIMAFAIVQYVFKVLEGGGGNGEAWSCTAGQCYGCNRCQPNGASLRCDESCGTGCQCSPLPFPTRELRIEDIQTSHAGNDNKRNVYWCSKVQTIYNRGINAQTVIDASSDPPALSDNLRIAAVLSPPEIADGTWLTAGHIVSFTPRDNTFINKDTAHQYYIPTSIKDDSADPLFLSACSLTAGCEEGSASSDFRWDFHIGNDGDAVNPSVVSTYPSSNDPNNIDMNVPRTPVLDITFTENIDALTVQDPNDIIHLHPDNIKLFEVGSGDIISNNTLLVQIKGNGFRFYLEDLSILEAFKTYQVELQDIQDLCGNKMKGLCNDDYTTQCLADADCTGGGTCGPYVWQFATNDLVPGVAGYYPDGNNICPDTAVSISFNTSMYYNQVEFQIWDDASNLSTFILRPVDGIIETSDNLSSGAVNGTFKVRDIDIDNISNHYRVFEFTLAPGRDLDENTTYNLLVKTDKIIDQLGTQLKQPWSFGVTDLASCVCTPYISHISSSNQYQGPIGECVTINGQCFKGTLAKPASIINNGPNDTGIKFDTISAFVPQESEYTANTVGTTVPSGFSTDDRPRVTMQIKYESDNTVPPSLASQEFLITAGQANGPCLWSIQPNYGQPGVTQVSMTGIRFGEYNPLGMHQAIFTLNAIFDVMDIDKWSDNRIQEVLVPSIAEDGQVVIENDQGQSNGIYFDTQSCGDGNIDPLLGEECDCGGIGSPCTDTELKNKQCTDFSFVGGTLACYPKGHTSQCRFDTTNCSNAPQVIVDSACSMVCDGGDRPGQICYNDSECTGTAPVPNGQCNIYTAPSPNPFPDRNNVCINAQISVRFNTDIDSNTINPNNVYIKECGDSQCAGLLTDVSASFSHIGNRSFILGSTANLSANQTYQITITDGIASPDPGSVNMIEDYIWKFTTTADKCDLQRVYVEPCHNILGEGEVDGAYHASPVGEFCTILNDIDYNWTWNIDDFNVPQLGVDVQEHGSDDAGATVTAGTEQGAVCVKAATAGKSDCGQLEISFDTCVLRPGICQDTDLNPMTGIECPGSQCDIAKDRCTPVIHSFSPEDGAIGTWINIHGCHFKSYDSAKSRVTFSDNQLGISPPAYCGSDWWTDKQIIIEVPALAVSGPFSISNIDDLATSTANINKNFIVNSAIRPGLCLLSPNHGKPSDPPVTLRGKNFGGTQEANDSVVFFDGLNSANNSLWEDTTIQSMIPDNVQTGEVYVSKNGIRSGALVFTIDEIKGMGMPCDGNADLLGCQASSTICTNINPNFFCDSVSNCTCQPTAPYVVNTEPVDLANNVCRNALITATFDQPMDYNSIASSTFQVGTMRTDGYDCDGNIIVRSDSFLSKIIAFFKKIFFIPLKSYAQTSIFCPIDGKIYLRDINNQTQVTFTPSELLGNKDNAMNYRAIARGELSGVKSALGGIMRSNKIWSFATSKKVCDIHHTKIDISKRDSVNSDIVTEQDATYDIFACVRDDCPDDISQLPGYDDMPGNQHQYFASAYDKDDTLLAAKFEWAENRYISQGLIDITVPPPPPPDSSISFITPNPIDGKTTLIIKASDANESDGLDYGSASGAITIINSMCKNPWPSPGQMFEDSANNCKPVTGNCNYNMTFASFYCRDFGHQEKYCEDNGSNCQNDSDCPDSQCRDYTYDDLPALSFSHPAPPTILGESNGVCVGGENHDEICANDSSCNNGVCKKVLKDFIFYFPDESDKWCTNSITPCQTDDGCIVGDVCEKNSDIINIKAYSNSEHLSPSAWYKKYVNDQAAYSTAQVDGYQAIVSGRETYINAAIDTDPIGSHSIWTDIFRISYSVKKSEIDGAEEAPNLITQTVFDRFYKNLIFNSDLSGNLQLCQNTTDEWCVKDSDCNPGVVCVAPKDKLARDVVRMGAIGEMVYYLDLYRGYCSNNQHLPCLEDAHCPGYDPADDQSEICISSVNPLYPTLDAGTYISGQAVSVWDKGQGRDSWVETFSSQLGAAISKDPINEVFCPMGYNDECWNEENKEFICGAGSHMFHYFSLNGGLSYNINTSMEYGMATGRSMPWKPVNNHFIANPPQPLCAPAGEETYNLLYDSNR